jgi:dihydroorotate dehydrogenase
MLFIGPPFGNYISLPNTISIRGSFTLHRRDPGLGLILRVLKTLRYSYRHRGWINRIGLRNPGIGVALRPTTHVAGKDSRHVYSIAVLHPSEIPRLVQKIPVAMNIELNVSCPNAEKRMVCEGLGAFVNEHRKWCIVKLSPHSSNGLIDSLYKQGFRQFHCSNTLPTPNGGLSGPSLRPYTSDLVTRITRRYPDAEVIAGGGILRQQDAEAYLKLGASHVAVSTLFFHPFLATLFFGRHLKTVQQQGKQQPHQ